MSAQDRFDRSWNVLFYGLIILIIGLLVVGALSGCSAKEVRTQVDKAQAETEAVLKSKERLDKAIEAAVASTEGEQYELIRSSLPPNAVDDFDRVVKSGRDALAFAANLSRALEDSARELLIRLEELETRLQNAQDSDDATLELITAGLAALFPVAAPIIGVISRRVGQREGAAHVTRTIAKARAKDPSFNGFFEGPLGTVMSAELNTKPRIAAVVRENKTIV